MTQGVLRMLVMLFAGAFCSRVQHFVFELSPDEGTQSTTSTTSETRKYELGPPPPPLQAGFSLSVVDKTGQIAKSYIPGDSTGKAMSKVEDRTQQSLIKLGLVEAKASSPSYTSTVYVRTGKEEPFLADNDEVLEGLLTRPGASVEVHIDITSEREFDAGLVKILRDAKRRDPSGKSTDQLAQEFRKQQIFRHDQVSHLNMKSKALNDLPADTHDMINQNRQEKIKEQSHTPQDKNEAEDKDKEAQEKAAKEKEKQQKADYQQSLKEDQDRSKDILDNLRENIQSGSDEAKQKAQDALNKIQEKLEQYSMDSMNLKLDTNKGKSAAGDLLAEAMSGNKDEGEALSVPQLIDHNGLFRGVMIQRVLSSQFWPRRKVAKFNKAFLDEYGQIIESQVLLNPQMSVTQFSQETDEATKLETMKRTVSQFGTSAADSAYAHASGGFKGFTASADFSYNSASAKSGSDDGSSQEDDSLEHYYKLTVFLEPRALLRIDLSNLEMEDSARDAWTTLVSTVERMEKNRLEYLFNTTGQQADLSNGDIVSAVLNTTSKILQRFVEDFGSHICPNALLGGRWSLTSTYTAENVNDKACASKAVSEATQSSIAASVAASYNAALASASLSGGYGHSKQQQDSNGSASCGGKAASSSHTEVFQEWFGGVSGLPVGDWRASLCKTKSSNWKLLDRYIDTCMPIWYFMQQDLERYGQSKWPDSLNVTYSNVLLSSLCSAWLMDSWKITNISAAISLCNDKFSDPLGNGPQMAFRTTSTTTTTTTKVVSLGT
eukprot:TRINITY_DN27187_c0_g1_i1.p1 TRINITY_DN27187_c0_g1~~TRINITY_DN27187_c0_g1_i1.p1  ORF type:complete len:776 (+),score=158.93 TRINITY_DN27187_c0_g1_i1:69-2396(+)